MTETSRGAMVTREFVLLSVILAAASGMMALFFQLQSYLTSLGIDPRWHGFLLGSDAITGIILQPLLSPYLNTGNAKKVLAAGVCIMAAALASYSLATTAFTVAVVRIVHGGGFVTIVAAMMALFAGYIPQSRSGEAIGIISMVRLLPYALVPPVVVHFARDPHGFISVVTAAAGVMALALVPLVFIRAATRGGTTLQKSAGLAGLAENLKSPPVVVLLLVNVLFYSGYTVLFYFLRDFGRAAGIGNPGFFFTLAMIIMILIRAVGSRYFDRANKAYVSAACLVMLAIAHLLFRFAGTEWVFMTLSVVFGVLWGVGIPVIMALVFDVSEARFRGLNMNLCLVAMQVGFFVGPLIGGIILARWGYGTLFLFCGILNMTGAALFVVMPRAGGR